MFRALSIAACFGLTLLAGLNAPAQFANLPNIFKVVLDNPAPGKVPQTPTFSRNPSTVEIISARVFEEPLVPAWGYPSPEENRALADALIAFSQRTRSDDFSALEKFLDSPIAYAWYGSLQASMGDEYYRTGYYSKAIEAWENAWLWLDGEGGYGVSQLASKTIGELMRMHSRIGNFERLEELAEEIGDRRFGGSASEMVTGAKQALWMMKNKPEVSFRCGPLALRTIARLLNSKANLDEILCRSASTDKGFSLAQLEQLAGEMQIQVQTIKRQPGGEFIVPSVVHWNVGHFAAIVRRDGDRYLVVDPTFGNSTWISRDALEYESSGYFLVPSNLVPARTPVVPVEESRTVFGKGVTTSSDPNNTTVYDQMADPECSSVGMAVYNMHLFLASLHIEDTPLAFAPPRGPPISFTLVYNQREANQPAVFTYGNLGQKWTCNWISYIKDSGTNQSADVEHYVGGGGTELFTYDTNSTYLVQWRNQSRLVRTSSTSYEMTMPDGSRHIFSQPDGSVGNSRKVFLTHIVDPTGYTNVLNYDPDLRLVSVTDGVTGVANLTLFYNNNPWAGPTDVIRMVNDRYSRSAVLGYPGFSSTLETITDVIGLTSKVFYASSFIKKLQTPYGDTTFAFGEDGSTRWLEATDFQGDKSRVEYKQSFDTGIPSSDPGTVVPLGMYTRNYILYGRNTFYWDKKTMREAPGDYSKARVYHWLHGLNGASAEGVLESYKEPLENRVWFNYPGQAAFSDAASYQPQLPGALNLPSRIGRVLDDGHTQLHEFSRNSVGYITNSIDPIGRTFTFNYATNQMDLLEVRQTRGTNNELVASFSYNSQHLPLTARDAAGQTNRFTYNSYGQLTGVTNALSQVTIFNYDTNGHLLNIDGPLAGTSDVTSFGYDSYDRVKAVTNSEGYFVLTSYDALNRPTTNTYPDGTFDYVSYKYLDPEILADRAGRITQYVFNPLRQLEEIREATNWVTRLDWCRCGDLDSITDPLGQVTRWFYDIQSRVTAKQYADNSRIEYGYEKSTSRLRTIKNERGLTRTNFYEYDDNLIAIGYANPSVTPNVVFTYDTNYNRLRAMSDGTGTTTFDYFPITNTALLGAGRLKSIDGPFSNDKLTYGYDALGRVVSESTDNVLVSPGYQNKVGYDALGRLSNSAPQGLGIIGGINYSYAGASTRLASINYPQVVSGSSYLVASFNYYDVLGDLRLKDITNRSYSGSSPGVISRFSYVYDRAGQITNWIEQIATANYTETNSLSYDALGQLTNTILKSSSATNTFGYTFDLAGNRTAEKIDTNTFRAWFNPLNEVVGKDNGSSVARSYEWDEENRVVAIIEGTNRTEVVYDALGQWKVLREKQNTNTVMTHLFIWSRGRVAEEAFINSSSVVHYQWHYDDVFFDTYYSAYIYPTRDHLGSVRENIGYLGDIYGVFNYDVFGRQSVAYSYPSLDSTFSGFAGMYGTPRHKLNLAVHRAYDPDLGRWLSRDPIEESGGLNLYSYANNDPINFVDPDGLCAQKGFAGGSGQYRDPNTGKIHDSSGNLVKDQLNPFSPLNVGSGGPSRPRSLSSNYYPTPDPSMDVPPVRYQPQILEEVVRMRRGLSPTTFSTHGNQTIEAHHRQQIPIQRNGVIDEITREVHRLDGFHSRHSRPSQLSPAQRAREIREHWIQRGSDYLLPGEGI